MYSVEYCTDQDIINWSIDNGAHQHVFFIDGIDTHSMLDVYKEMLEWCIVNVGPDDDTLWETIPKLRCITFQKETDAFAFRMRWC